MNGLNQFTAYLFSSGDAFFVGAVHDIDDSLSAGIASEQVRLWPNLLASEWHVPVQNHAQAGVTTASAFRQAEEIE